MLNNFTDRLDSFKLESSITAQLQQIESRIQVLEQSVHQPTDLSWMALSKAANLTGLSTAALRQRIKRHRYPEGVVWKQQEFKGAIFVNYKKLLEFL